MCWTISYDSNQYELRGGVKRLGTGTWLPFGFDETVRQHHVYMVRAALHRSMPSFVAARVAAVRDGRACRSQHRADPVRTSRAELRSDPHRPEDLLGDCLTDPRNVLCAPGLEMHSSQPIAYIGLSLRTSRPADAMMQLQGWSTF